MKNLNPSNKIKPNMNNLAPAEADNKLHVKCLRFLE